MGIRVRNVLTGLLYQKSLYRPANAVVSELSETNNDDSNIASMGKIVILMSVDADKIGEFLGLAFTPLTTFLQIGLCITGLMFLLGWPALVGVVVMIIIMISGVPLANLINNAFQNLMTSRDNRTTLMNEIVQGIRAIKFFAWYDISISFNLLTLGNYNLNPKLKNYGKWN